MAEDPDFRHLLQRELIDGDESRLRLVAEHVFREPFEAISALSRDLDPNYDPTHVGDLHGRAHPVSLRDCAGAPIPAGVREGHDSPAMISSTWRLLSRALLLTK